MDPYLYMDDYFLQSAKEIQCSIMMVFSKSSQICQVVTIGNRNPKWQWLKDRQRKGKAHKKGTKQKSESWSESLSSWLALSCIRQISEGGGGRQNMKKEEAKMDWGLSCRSGPPTHLRDGLSLPSKILSCDTGPPFQIFVVVRQN